MKVKEQKIKLNWVDATLEYFEYEQKDKVIRWRLFKARAMTNKLLKLFWARWANLPEWISEIAFCMVTGAVRFKEVRSWKEKVHASFDTYNLKTGKTQQIKASSVSEDLTSFWPKSERDELYFMDFSRLDWTFDVYFIDSEYIYWNKVNQKESFTDQQEQKRRPRFSIVKKIIIPHKLKPILKNVHI